MSKLVFHDAPPPGRWFILDVMRKGDERRPFRPGRPRNDWAALLIDVEPDLFVRTQIKASQHWLDLGRHKNLDAAWERAEAMIATKH